MTRWIISKRAHGPRLSHCGMMSMKQILFDVAPAALRIVSRLSRTVTVDVASSHGAALDVIPLMVRTPSTLMRNVLPKYDGSPATMRTVYLPFGTAISQNASGFPGRCIYASVSYRSSGEFGALRLRIWATFAPVKSMWSEYVAVRPLPLVL